MRMNALIWGVVGSGLALGLMAGADGTVHSGAAAHAPTPAQSTEHSALSTWVALSSPLVTVGEPFNVVLTVQNTGLGTYWGGDTLSLRMAAGAPGDCFGEAAARALDTGVLKPGETRRYCWKGLKADAPGSYDFTSPCPVSFKVLQAEPAPWPEHTADAVSSATRKGSVVAAVANAWSRLRFVTGNAEGDMYAIAETWDGGAWQRVGTLYPLAQGVVVGDSGEPHRLDFKLHGVEHGVSGRQRLDLLATGPSDTAWYAALTFEAEPQAPRFKMTCTLTAPVGAGLVCFYGPTVLAGDRAYGAGKDFAIFPGVEYLKGDEESSSERDLAYPLSDRRVPAVHKIATPLMAVQGRDSLIALLWDANQEWTRGEAHPAARFLAPRLDSGIEHVHMSLFAPSIGDYVRENAYGADETPYRIHAGGQEVKLESWLVLDHKARYPSNSVVHGPHEGGLVLQAVQHWLDVYGFPEPSEPPRDWDAERALCRHAYAHAVWSEDPPGWKHCHGWAPGLLVGHTMPQMLDIRAGVGDDVRAGIERRIALVLQRALKENGKHYLWTNAGCHIMMAELPFYYGYVAESMVDFKNSALRSIAGREKGLWVWRPADEKHESLGTPGDHTLGQASNPSFRALRAARMTGDPELIEQALEAMKQMELYDIPRGAQTWECPLYQPDILAAGQAIRAYCEAYRITGDPVHLDHARYWAWTGLPFLYLWELEGYPTMRYNVIAVIGSTFFTHSWIGLPVVWCGEVYAYALQDLAQFDGSFDWTRVATGINHSTMWQQYAEGPSKGCYPDSWNMVKNRPNPANINPENILANEFRLLGPSPEIRCARFQGQHGPIMLNSAADILEPRRDPDGAIWFSLKGVPGFPVYSMLAPVAEPKAVEGAGVRAAHSDALQAAETGWLYNPELRAVVLKHRMRKKAASCAVSW